MNAISTLIALSVVLAPFQQKPLTNVVQKPLVLPRQVAQRPKFLPTKDILTAFQKANVKTTGKKLSGGVILSPRTSFLSFDLFVDTYYMPLSSNSANQWTAAEDSAFEVHKTFRGDFLVTLSAFGRGDCSFDVITLAGGLQTARSTMSFAAGGGQYMTIPVVVSDPGSDHVITIRMKTGAGCYVQAIEVRELS